MRYIFLLLSLTFFINQNTAQTSLTGRVLDPEYPGEGLIGATVKVLKGTNIVTGTVTDFDGYYRMSLDPGTFNFEFSFTGYATKTKEGVQILVREENTLPDMRMEVDSSLDDIELQIYKIPLYKQESTLTPEQIRNLPTRSINQIVPSTEKDTTKKEIKTSLQGRVLDPEYPGEGLIGATVKVLNGTDIVAGTVTDFDGYFRISIDPGAYSIEVAYTGYATKRIEGVQVLTNQTNKIPDVELQTSDLLEEVVVIAYKVPLIKQDQTSSGMTYSSDKIRNLPTRNINKLSKKQRRKANKANIKGSRSNASNYYIDGIRVSANSVQVEEKTKKAKRNRFFSWSNPNKEKPKDDLSGEQYNQIVENKFIKAEKESISTFSIDVDGAAYANVRRHLEYGQLPPKDAVRIEELINYFPYDYAPPTNGKPFAVYTELGLCPWNTEHQLLRVALKGQNIDVGQLPASNLVFLLDVSGSMASPNKLPLVKKSLKMLTEQMRPQDRVAIVVYAGAAGLVLPSTSAKEKAIIFSALENLTAGGSTAGGAGIELAYQTAESNFVKNGNNRVILCTDGDFNVGISNQGGLDKLIEKKREKGVFLTVLGFGMGNYQDGKMQSLSNKGNGNHAYIDSEKEAKKVLVKEFGGTMYAIAKDVKLQLYFNPEAVKSYRLIGYENRLLAKEDFDDDTKDAGELGVGHTVTALYEIDPMHDDRVHSDLLTLKLRYKKVKKGQDKKSFLIEHKLSEKPVETPSESFQLAANVAQFGLLLRDSEYKGKANWDGLYSNALKMSEQKNASELVAELTDLIDDARELTLEKGATK